MPQEHPTVRGEQCSIRQDPDQTEPTLQLLDHVAASGAPLLEWSKSAANFSLGQVHRVEAPAMDHPELIIAPAADHDHETQHDLRS